MSASPGVVVVGVDESRGSVEALRWAIGLAQRIGCRVRAVHAYDVPAYPLLGLDDWLGTARQAAERVLWQAVNTATGGANPPVPVQQIVVRGHASTALEREADGADLLVVGSRGYGEVSGIVLGSVGLHVVTHCQVPVVVVPPSAAARGTGRALLPLAQRPVRSTVET